MGGDLTALADRVGDALLPAADDGSTARLHTRSEESTGSVPEQSIATAAGSKPSDGEDDHHRDDDGDDDGDDNDSKSSTKGHKTQQQRRLSRIGEDSTKTVARGQDADPSASVPDELKPILDHDDVRDRSSSSNTEDSNKETEVVCGEGGKHRKVCRKGKVCCNDIIGTCVSRGHTCLQTTCNSERGVNSSCRETIPGVSSAKVCVVCGARIASIFSEER